MDTAELEFPPIDLGAQPARSAIVAATPAATDIAAINLKDLALAKFGPWRDATAKVKAELTALVLDLGTQAAIDDAISLRNRKIRQPLADARKVAEGLKSKLAAVSKAVGAELPLIEAAYEDAATAITPRIEAAQRALDDAKEAARLAEQQRLQALRDKVDDALGKWVDRCKTEGITAERIGNGIAALQAVGMPADAADVAGYWDTRKAATIQTMVGLQLERQRLENERAAAELAERQREIDAQAAALRQQEAAAAAAREQEAEAAQARAAATLAADASADPADTGARKAENPAHEREAAQDSQRQESGAQPDPNATGNGNMAHQTAHAAPGGGQAEGVAVVPATATPGCALAENRAQDAPPAGAAEPEAATLKLGDINAKLGFTMTSVFVRDTLGISAAAIKPPAHLYTPSQVATIKAALKAHIDRVL